MPFSQQQADIALNAYLSLLKNKGAATNVTNMRKHMLRHLISALEAQADRYLTDDDSGYRRAVDHVIKHFPDDQQVEIINVSREFYPFWIGDLRTIARLNAANALTLESLTVDVSGTLMDMFERLDRASWGKEPPVCLSDYLDSLVAQGADASVIDIRERLILLLLFIIRNAEPIPTAYRAGVDAMLTLFSKEDTRRIFIDVAREFFYFWNRFHSGDESDTARAA